MNYFLSLAGTLCCLIASAQSPFAGMSITEVAIPADIQVELQNELGTTDEVHCYRLFICLNDPNWELQAIHGESTDPWVFSIDGQLYQHIFGGGLASDINPVLYELSSTLEYDSWFTIGNDSHPSSVLYVESTDAQPLTLFEQGRGFVENSIIGSTIFGSWLPPNTEGTPDEDGNVLIGQFTTTGTITGEFNFQFRKLNEDNTIYLPIMLENEAGVCIEINQTTVGSSCADLCIVEEEGSWFCGEGTY